MRKYKYTLIGDFRIEVASGKNLRFFGLGVDIGGYEGDELQIVFYMLFMHVWLTYSARWVYKLCGFIASLHGKKYGRSYNSHIHLGTTFSLKLFGDHCGDDALYRKYIDIPDKLRGRSKCTVEVLQTGETQVIMPEKAYPATYTIERRTWTYPRWFTQHRTDIEITVLEKGGIPHEGKGENSWDCGMEGTISRHSEYKDSVHQAANEFAMGVLRDRQRHSRLDIYGVKVPEGEALVATPNAAV